MHMPGCRGHAVIDSRALFISMWYSSSFTYFVDTIQLDAVSASSGFFHAMAANNGRPSTQPNRMINVSVIGEGNVGMAIAQTILTRHLAMAGSRGDEEGGPAAEECGVVQKDRASSG